MRPVLIAAVLALAAVYLAVWPHELGHAGAAWWLGCKADPWRTDTHWYLAGSQGGAIDEACLAQHGEGAVVFTAVAGIAVNLILVLLAPLLGRWWLSGRSAAGRIRWGLVATLLWALANAAEAVSYLVINTLWPASDMRTVIAASGSGAWPWTAAGLAIGAAAGLGFRRPVREAADALGGGALSPRLWCWTFGGYGALVGLAAVASRLGVP